MTIAVLLASACAPAPPKSENPATPANARGAFAKHAQPNVVLITVESLRTDHVGVYGGKSRTRPELPLTPTIDALAGESMLYENANSVTSWTLASHASIFTGLYPGVHQTRHSTDRLDDSYETLAERLAAAGYDTAGVISGPYLRPAHNLSQGFAHYHDETGTTDDLESHGQTTCPRMLSSLHHVFDEELDPSRPFFVFAYFWDPHYDYLPPDPYDRMYRTPSCEPVDMHDYETTETVHAGMPDAQMAYVWSQYEGEIRWTDKHLAELFDLLRERGLWDDTVVIVTADHGEEFFDHGEKGHFHNVYAETVHVPLVVKYPAGGAKGRDPRLASLVDVVPTVLDLAGIARPALLDGQSLLTHEPDPGRAIYFELLSSWRVPDYLASPAAGGQAGGWTPVAFFRWLLTPPTAPPTRKSYRTWSGIREGTQKLVVCPELGRRQLFDVAADPVESNDVSREHVADVERLQQRIAAHQSEERSEVVRFHASGEAPLTPEDKEHLRSLGYLQ